MGNKPQQLLAALPYGNRLNKNGTSSHILEDGEMRILFVLMVGGLFFLPGWANAQVTTTDLKLKSGDGEFRAVLALPEGQGPFPAVVVIQEFWGLNDWIIENAKRFAAHGYVAIAPDLYHGKVTDDPMVARQLMQGMPQDRALRDLKTCVDELCRNPKVNKDKIGSIGWCMGGGLSLTLARNDDRDIACAMCYGRVVTTPDAVKNIKGSVLGVFGEKDQGIPVAGVKQFEQALKDSKKDVAGIHIYPAGHGFMRPTNNPAYHEESAKDAWKQIDAFFAKQLGGK
jgi:carboxymethylenebutenolidase